MKRFLRIMAVSTIFLTGCASTQTPMSAADRQETNRTVAAYIDNAAVVAMQRQPNQVSTDFGKKLYLHPTQYYGFQNTRQKAPSLTTENIEGIQFLQELTLFGEIDPRSGVARYHSNEGVMEKYVVAVDDHQLQSDDILLADIIKSKNSEDLDLVSPQMFAQAKKLLSNSDNRMKNIVVRARTSRPLLRLTLKKQYNKDKTLEPIIIKKGTYWTFTKPKSFIPNTESLLDLKINFNNSEAYVDIDGVAYFGEYVNQKLRYAVTQEFYQEYKEALKGKSYNPKQIQNP